MPERNQSEEACDFLDVMTVVGGKWRGTIVFCLGKGPMRFGHLRDHIASITQKMLTKELRSLERDGLVHREHHREIPPRVEYSLTPLGESMRTIFEGIDEWSSHLPSVAAAQRPYDARSNT